MKNIILNTFFIAFIINLHSAFSCQCDPPVSPSVAYSHADIVFSGKVKNIVIDSSSIFLSKKVFIDVIDSWKGDLSGLITIWTAFYDASCGYNFEINSSYLVYGYSYNDSVSTNSCTRTNLLQWANEDLEYLESLSSIKENENIIPNSIYLYQNYPNPFNAHTTIKFYIDKNSKIELLVYDLQGKFVQIIINDYFVKGINSINFHARQLPSGIYYYRLITHDQIITKKMLLIQ